MDARTRYFVARKLGEFNDAAAVPALLEMLDDADGVVQKNAVVALGNIQNLNNPAAIEKLMVLLGGSLPREKEMLRVIAGTTLGKIGEPAVPGLAALVADEKQTFAVRLNAIKALGRSKTTSAAAVDALLPAVTGKDAFLREAAVESLGQMRAPQALSLIHI